MRKIGIAMLFTVLLLAGELSAAESSNYGALKLGYFMPNNDSDGLEDFDNRGCIGLAFGHKFSKQFAVEIGYEYYSTEGDFYESLTLEDADTGDLVHGILSEEDKITVWTVPVTAKILFPVSNELTGFLGAGIGFYNVKGESDVTWSASGYYPVNVGSMSDTGNCYGFHLVAGADLAISSNAALGLELKWSKAEQELEGEIDGEEIELDDINVGGTTINFVGKVFF